MIRRLPRKLNMGRTYSNAFSVRYCPRMAHRWMMVKNARSGGRRPPEEYRTDAQNALDRFEAGLPPGSKLHPSVQEYVGVAEGDRVVDIESLISSPYPFLQGHEHYLFGVLATPTNVSDGLAEFTSLAVLASKTELLTFIIDPPSTYAGPFGQRILNRHERHTTTGGNDVGATVLMIVRDNVTSLNFALRELELDLTHYSEGLFRFDTSRRRDGSELLQMIELYLIKLRAEIESLATVVEETARLVEAISGHQLTLNDDAAVFNKSHEISAQALVMQVRRLVALRNRLAVQVVQLLEKCDRLHEKFFAEATHTIGAITALLLLPSLIVGFYGQSVDFSPIGPLAGLNVSLVLIIGSSIAAFLYARRRQWF